MKFSETSVSKLSPPAGSKDYIEWDPQMPGFGIRFQNGAKRGTFVCQYRLGTKQRRISIGKVGKITLEKAQNIAKGYFGDVAAKKDPATERAKAETKVAKAVKPMIEPFLEHLRINLKRAPSYIKDNKRTLERRFQHLHGFAPDDVDRETVATELRRIAKDYGPIAMNRCRSHLSHFFNWMIGEGHTTHNPVYRTNTAEENIRDRLLSATELASIWNACDGDKDSDKIIRLLMLTAARRDQIGKLVWSEINFAEQRIELPGKQGRTKNKKTFWLPLSRQAFDILKSVKRSDDCEFVFGRDGTGFSGHSNALERVNEIMAERKTPVHDWRFHDLRAAFMTHAQEELGLPFYVCDLLLSHAAREVTKGAAKNYNFASYLKEKTEAMTAWGNWIEGLTSPTKKEPSLRLVA